MAQKGSDLGEGSVKISMFYVPAADTARMDTTNRAFMKFHYFIFHHKVLRRDASDGIEITKSANTKPLNKSDSNISITTSLSAHMVIPSYVIDWDKKTISTFFLKNGKSCISEDSVQTYTQDFFYRLMAMASTSTAQILIDTAHAQPVIVCGIKCIKANYLHSSQSGWHQFIYFKKDLNFISPLNGLLNNKFPFPVISIDMEVKGDAKEPNKITGVMRGQITEIDTKKQNPLLFELPPNTLILKNVPYSEMYKNN